MGILDSKRILENLKNIRKKLTNFGTWIVVYIEYWIAVWTLTRHFGNISQAKKV